MIQPPPTANDPLPVHNQCTLLARSLLSRDVELTPEEAMLAEEINVYSLFIPVPPEMRARLGAEVNQHG